MIEVMCGWLHECHGVIHYMGLDHGRLNKEGGKITMRDVVPDEHTTSVMNHSLAT
jgi:hypothetical protein